MNDLSSEERPTCTECGARVRVLSPQLCDGCLNGPVTPAPEVKAVECCRCHVWSTQTVLRADAWDTAKLRPWCPTCIEQAAREAKVYSDSLIGDLVRHRSRVR